MSLRFPKPWACQVSRDGSAFKEEFYKPVEMEIVYVTNARDACCLPVSLLSSVALRWPPPSVVDRWLARSTHLVKCSLSASAVAQDFTVLGKGVAAAPSDLCGWRSPGSQLLKVEGAHLPTSAVRLSCMGRCAVASSRHVKASW